MSDNLTRRHALALTLAAPLVLRLSPAGATPETMRLAIEEFTRGAPVEQAAEGAIELKIPLLVENGNSVPLSVRVTSPMTPEDHVEEVAIFNEVNPLPDTVRFRFTPRSGTARADTRIRLNGTQRVHAVARLSDGRHIETYVHVTVTAPACREV
ncbi:thiosulfate oxidation carrier protein SoxY [Wenxinia marina]|uniref:Putative secreted protein n=1 Tax=Wenxinia marina DSM 24838 TaxID=1123501 RepID=A0A0D0QGA0_9RHOB|nr:thiosulfate oxidation carrier protein SoxY [Wenxinia marina]KIQ70058.1 putative secreted protein [Wenxinia marina DSM 24838]GGL63183.1 sulfur oxidation protein SoxY [Wenxinia marina]